MKKETEDLVQKFINIHGEKALIDELERKPNKENGKVLTIISNGGVHPLNALHQRGEVFVASEGNIDFSTKSSTERAITKILHGVASKLQSQTWETIYLVPFGPSVLSMLIKSLVYKVLYIETIDVLHAGESIHFDIEIDPRVIAIESTQIGKD